MFENVLINGYIYATRFIASWIRVGGTLNKHGDLTKFRKWLESLGLSEEDIHCITFLAMEGKLELQENAKKFLIWI